MDLVSIPKEVKGVLNRILDEGGQAYIVGGALRDHIMGREIFDWDIATSLLPEEIEYKFKDMKIVTTGRRFGTMTVVTDRLPIEITTYRVEGDYRDFRRPDRVKFTPDIYEDLKRRDFTMNAMAFNPILKHRQFIDPYKGYKDIKKGIIRAVGNPHKRFCEDALRMMRAIRFMSELGFTIEDNTLDAIAENSHLIKNISVERIRDELNKTLLGSFPVNSIKTLYDSRLLTYIMPRATKYLDSPSIEHIASIISRCDSNLLERISALFLWTTKIEDGQVLLKKILRGLKYDNDTRRNVSNILSAYNTAMVPSSPNIEYRLRKLMGSIGVDNTLIALRLKKYTNKDIKNLIQNVECILARKDPIHKSDLKIDGYDIISLGIGQRDKRDIGRILDTAYDWVLKDPNANNKDILLSRISNLDL